MTLWGPQLRRKKSKIIVMAIKVRLKQPLYVAELNLKDNSKGPRPHKIRLLTGKKKEEFIPPQQFIEILRSANRIMLAEGGTLQMRLLFWKCSKVFNLKR